MNINDLTFQSDSRGNKNLRRMKMSKLYLNTREVIEDLLNGKRIEPVSKGAFSIDYVKLNEEGNLVNQCGNIIKVSLSDSWQEYIEPVTLEMAIAHYKATGKPFMRRAYIEDSWGVGGFVFHEEDITATDYVLLDK